MPEWIILCCEVIGLIIYAVTIRAYRWWGWLLICAFVAVPWLIYSIVTDKPAFILLSVVWIGVHLRNAYSWRRDL